MLLISGYGIITPMESWAPAPDSSRRFDTELVSKLYPGKSIMIGDEPKKIVKREVGSGGVTFLLEDGTRTELYEHGADVEIPRE